MAHAAAIGAAGRVPAVVAEPYSPPGQPSNRKYCSGSMSSSRWSSSDAPLKHHPYLWMSADNEVTPSTRKSHGGSGSPSRSRNGSSQPPRQASTWHSAPRSPASAASSGIGSTTPYG